MRRCSVISENKLMINEEIKDKEVRLIDSDGSMLGVTLTKEAQALASSKSLDLVKIAPQAAPPVCKIMDYGKYIFNLAKKERDSKKRQKVTEIKEIRVTPSIEQHDFDFKVKNAGKFLMSGDKVKVMVRFRGREMSYTALGYKVLEEFAKATGEFGVTDKPPKLEGKNMTMILAPKPVTGKNKEEEKNGSKD